MELLNPVANSPYVVKKRVGSAAPKEAAVSPIPLETGRSCTMSLTGIVNGKELDLPGGTGNSSSHAGGLCNQYCDLANTTASANAQAWGLNCGAPFSVFSSANYSTNNAWVQAQSGAFYFYYKPSAQGAYNVQQFCDGDSVISGGWFFTPC